MSRRRVTPSLVASLVAVLIAVTAPAPATFAADPTPAYRPDRPAWDRVATTRVAATAGDTASASAGDAPAPDGQYIIRFRPGTGGAARRAATAHPGVVRIADEPQAGIAVVRIPDTGGADVVAALAALRADRHVLDVSVDAKRYRDADPTDEPGWTEEWGLDNTGQRIYQGKPGTEGTPDVDIDGRQALDVEGGDPAVVVAVIDDGVDFSHPDLAARAWTNPGESGGGKESNGIDDDHNGYIDDVHGWDFCHDDNTVHDFDDDFHGTHVAGTIAASLNGQGIVGVAPNIKIMALKFINNDPHSSCGRDSQAIAAIAYAKSFGVRIANASWGARGAQHTGAALKSAIANSGMLFVASAGNDGIDNDTDPFPALPASFDLTNILAVAAVDNRGAVPDFSNYGKKTVDLAAPGVGILSALPADSNDPVGWGWLDGTSMAAPHVTGVAALVLSKWPALGSDPAALKARILGAAKAAPGTKGRTATGGIVDALRALDDTAPAATAPTGFGFVRGSVLGSTGITARISWPAATDDLTGIAAYRVGAQANGGGWSTAVSSTPKRSTDRTVTFGTRYAFRVRARDGAGNWGTDAVGPIVRASRLQQATSLATYSRHWSTSKSRSWSGGTDRFSARAGASVTFRFTGRAVAIVAPMGPSRGAFRLFIDGVAAGTVDLHRSTSKARVVVLAKTWSAIGAHTIRLVVAGTKGHPRVDIDAFLVMR